MSCASFLSHCPIHSFLSSTPTTLTKAFCLTDWLLGQTRAFYSFKHSRSWSLQNSRLDLTLLMGHRAGGMGGRWWIPTPQSFTHTSGGFSFRNVLWAEISEVRALKSQIWQLCNGEEPAPGPGDGSESSPKACGEPPSLLSVPLPGTGAYDRQVGLLISGFIFQFSRPGFLEVCHKHWRESNRFKHRRRVSTWQEMRLDKTARLHRT